MDSHIFQMNYDRRRLSPSADPLVQERRWRERMLLALRARGPRVLRRRLRLRRSKGRG
jgi:hypothetical protein